MRIYPYLRASADDQDASRAKNALTDFVKAKGFKVSTWFIENISGAQLDKPELMRLLDVAEHGDVYLLSKSTALAALIKMIGTRLKVSLLARAFGWLLSICRPLTSF